MKNIYLTIHNEWNQLGKKFNWYTATLINIEFENEPYTGGLEMRFILFGLGFTLRYNYDFENSPTGKKVKEHFEESIEELDKKIDDLLYESDCCGAKVGVTTADEGTSHWVCKKCGEACDRKSN